MYQQHFNTIGSTQTYLKENWETLRLKDHDILISCSRQTEGVGRKGNTWETFPNGLALSFTLKPNPIPSLTPLEIGLMTINFFRKKFKKDLVIKWPNDILDCEGNKCGGIICHYVDNSTVIAGLGINLGKFEMPSVLDFPCGLGCVDKNLELNTQDQERISREIYEEMLEHRILNTENFKNIFNRTCAHLNKKVSIYENGVDHVGIFKGIGGNGEALVEINSSIETFISSSLTILD
ncbi:MAG: biotin--[acetyl-CoA-carboxylase] ligase [Bacteriovorax sp.]|jgi:BirA family biotin operon repressor/biotin-[acetyl-CoA-carboxylase] ligase